ncbi:MAG TPA: kelch repeat-containing protein [Vicinamibacterales bacterium]
MTRHRIVFFLTSAALFLAPALFAAAPSARTATRMVYDPRTTYTVLFGGQSPFDAGTSKAYNLSDTWDWVGDHWVQVYPATTPAGRSFQTMAYDATHSRITMFGGKTDALTGINETWVYDGNDWTQLTPATAPSPRIWSGSAYDTARNRIVLYGGQFTTSDLKTTTNYYDTWEFDGTNWTQVANNGPQVTTPLLAYYEPTQQLIMLGSDTSQKPHMYSYNPSNTTWTEMTPATMPDCVNDAGLVYQAHDPKVLVLYAGTCTSSGTLSNTYEWDGNNWALVTPPSGTFRLTGEAMAYDPARRTTTIFGGTEAFSVPLGATYVYHQGVWSPPPNAALSPSPRSLFAFNTDPLNNVIWLVGGMDDTSTLDDIWKYSNGTWQEVTFDSSPSACVSPVSAYDTDRQKLIIVCQDVSVHEFDGTTWKTVNASDLKTVPQVRRFSAMAYDANVKKTVLFGGFNDTNYVNETWTWDGSLWTQIKNNAATARSHAAMWFDPNMNRTVLYGGIGQPSTNDRITRYDDMWSFDGTGWTQMKSVTATPGPRYGAQVTVNPVDGKAYLFGGLELIVDGAKQSQVYKNDLWVWDGKAQSWSQVNTATIPPERENGGLAFDPIANELVLVAGYAGYYRSDVWSLRAGNWVLHPETLPQPIRRGVRH